MPIVFAAATSHAPGIVAWADAAPPEQKTRVYDAFAAARAAMDAARAEVLVLLTSEHWTNYFLDHMSAFCIGRADHYDGPVEPWLKLPRTRIPGEPALAGRLVEHCYEAGIEPGFAYEMELDHGTMVPLSFLAPDMARPIVPIMFNTLAAPQPQPRRCLDFGRALGATLRDEPRRIAVIATGGLSHDPGERKHGTIYPEFDRRFLAEMAAGDVAALGRYRLTDFANAGGGAFEMLNWLGLAGVLDGSGQGGRGRVLAYEPVKPWATGIGVLGFDLAA